VDYFPLHVGNQWIYRVSGRIGGSPVVVDIPRTETISGRQYAVVRGFDEGEALLRMDERGILYRYNPDTRQEEIWAEFETEAGRTYRTAINPCNNTARVDSRSEMVRTPAGEFSGALAISYPAANCADAGLTGEVYLPWIGLVKRTALTIAGPRAMELAYARIGGATILSEPEIAFGLTLDRAVYSPDQEMTARMTLRVTDQAPLKLVMASGQSFEILFKDSAGGIVWRWSDGKVFTQALRPVETGPGELTYAVRVLLGNGTKPLPVGHYAAEAFLNTYEGGRYAASVGFAVAGGR
jgi:hypothetical protein